MYIPIGREKFPGTIHEELVTRVSFVTGTRKGERGTSSAFDSITFPYILKFLTIGTYFYYVF